MPPVRLMTQLLMFKPWVPRRFRFWSVMTFALFYQFTGGVYLAALSQMTGELAFINEDVTMASYCSLIGLNIIFPILFRWKFYFYTRQMFFVSSIGALTCAVLAMYCNIPWMLWLVCLCAGYFKMMGMFSCISTIQLNMTPTRSFGVFLPVIYVLVCGAVQLSGIVTSLLAYWGNWRLIYLVIVTMMLIIDGIVYFMMKPDHRSAPFVPLKGVDWTGHILWTATLCVAAWIFCFGNHYDWWDSMEIWYATWIFIVLLPLTLYKSAKNDAFIPLAAFKFDMTWKLCLLLAGMGLVQASAHVLLPVYLNASLHYDQLTIITFNYPELFGIIMGAILAYVAIIRLRWDLRQFFFCCFLFELIYISTMYHLVSWSTSEEILYIPFFLFGVAESMMETGVTYALSQSIPFQYFFANISIVGFVRCGMGTSAFGAAVERLFDWSMQTSLNLEIALRESFGYLCFVCIIMLIIILMSNYKTTVKQLVPRLITVARTIHHTS